MRRSVLFVMAMALGASCTLAVGLRAQGDSVQVTTFVRCPQLTLLDSLRAHERASQARTDSLGAWLLLHMPSCPAAPPIQVPPAPSPTFMDQVAKWGPLVIGTATLVAVLLTRNKVEQVEKVIIEKHYERDDRRVP